MRQQHAQGTLLNCFAIIACLCATVGRADESSGNLGEPIDRHALVTRHNVHIDKILPMSPLHLGNGSMVFTADFTGLQTFYHHYDRGLPLQTVAGWAWNQFPNEKELPYAAVMHDGQYQGRPFKYIATKTPQQVHYRGAIHRFNLARIGLDLKRENGEHMFTATLADIDQQLDLWNGSIQSRFTFDGKPVEVHTVVHPEQDVLAIRLKSPMVRESRCNLKMEFPYPRGSKDLPTDYFERSMLPNWFQPERDGWQLVDAPLDVNVLGSDIPFRVYRKRFKAGTHVFGANNWPECQVRSNVFPLFGDPDGGSAAKHVEFEVSTDKSRYRLAAGGVKKGQPVWTDRDYAISRVGESLRGLDMIMVCNVDEEVYTNEHFRITIEKPLDIYMAWQWHPNRHATEILHQEFNKTDIRRTIDGTSHHVSIQHSPGISVTKTGANKLAVTLSQSKDDWQEVVVSFGRDIPMFRLPTFADVKKDAAKFWNDFWTTGGAIDFSGSKDKRASELERRVVLSQYITAISCSGKEPEMPSGLNQITYYGTTALEVTQWNRAHFPFWGRGEYLQNVMPWYRKALPSARWYAKQRGFKGAEYLKGVLANGRALPSGDSWLYVTHTPNPIFYLESMYRNNRDEAYLREWSEIVFEVADFIASTMKFDEKDGHYDLGPAIEPQQEGHHSLKIYNPPFEVAFMIWGLETAQRWRERLGLTRKEEWQHIIDHMAPLAKKDGLYLVSENFDDTWTNPARRSNHISILNTYGFLPRTHDLDPKVMHATLTKTLEPDGWNWANSFGFNYPHIAMCAARLGETEAAIDVLFRHTEGNQWMPSGSVPINPRGVWAISTVPAANGNLLLAMAMMCAGWEGCPDRHAPGFADNGQWRVRWEGLNGYF